MQTLSYFGVCICTHYKIYPVYTVCLYKILFGFKLKNFLLKYTRVQYKNKTMGIYVQVTKNNDLKNK